MKLVQRAAATRHTAATRLNRESSRSHCIITLTVEQRGPASSITSIGSVGTARHSVSSRGAAVAPRSVQGLQAVKRAKLYLVDLVRAPEI